MSSPFRFTCHADVIVLVIHDEIDQIDWNYYPWIISRLLFFCLLYECWWRHGSQPLLNRFGLFFHHFFFFLAAVVVAGSSCSQLHNSLINRQIISTIQKLKKYKEKIIKKYCNKWGFELESPGWKVGILALSYMVCIILIQFNYFYKYNYIIFLKWILYIIYYKYWFINKKTCLF